jgi:hypothetical protein
LKICSKCHTEKEDTDYYKGTAVCKPCTGLYQKARKKRIKLEAELAAKKLKNKEQYAKYKDKAKARTQTPEFREKQNAYRREYLQRPEVREKRLALNIVYNSEACKLARKQAADQAYMDKFSDAELTSLLRGLLGR